MQWKEVLAGITLLIGGKLAVMAAVGPLFGLTKLAAVRAGLLLAPGVGERRGKRRMWS